MRWSVPLLRGPGRLVALGVLALALLLRVFDFGSVAEFRLRMFDLEERLWPRSSDAARVVVVDIDENSLARYGQWPWPRTQVAELVRRIAQGHPRVLGIDIVFAERDRLSPPVFAELPGLPPPLASELRQLPSTDRDLAEAMRAVPTVLALAPGRDELTPASGLMHASPIRHAGEDPNPFLKDYPYLLDDLPELREAAKGAGAIAVEPDADGIVRRIGLAVSHNDSIVPGFALEVLSVGGAERSIVIEAGAGGVESISVGGVKISTDQHARVMPHFAPRLARYISAVEILDPAFDPSELRSKIVLLGVAGLGVADLQWTPLGLLVQGVEVHAQLIEAVLLNALLRRPSYLNWIECFAAMLAGGAAIWLLPYDRLRIAVGIAVGVVAGLIGLQVASFVVAGVLFDGTYPAAAMLAAFGVMVVGHLRVAQLESRREREAKERLEGELSTAQRIQVSLLPRRLPAFPERPEIDVYPHIQPARIMGGDFYDYLLIDGDRRLFFLIADVCGKGPPAAVLMAVTKEVVREAVLKYGTALDRVLAEANRKTAIASAELESEGGVFVTAFAGILDPFTGFVIYASAGHDSPFIVGSGNGLRQLETVGGPPLGTVDAFAYPIDRGRIGPGEVMVLYTDGVTEAENADRTLYTRQRLAAALAKASTISARGVVTAVIDDLRCFVGKAEQADDITLLAVRVVPGGAALSPLRAT
jgi:adenylate cyclase